MDSIYSKIGPEKLRAIVDSFYDLVFVNEIIGPLFQTDKSLIRDKQYQFLTQFLGGPHLYSASYGHPRMRMRHLPHKIDQVAMEEWLRCMRKAIDTGNNGNDNDTDNANVNANDNNNNNNTTTTTTTTTH
ncbi:MAG: globin [bacterium]|nr:globin [bacterium]